MIDYPLEKVVEGTTEILVPNVELLKKPSTHFPPKDAPVFYNKVMEFNRDFALAALRVFMKMHSFNYLRYCEPLAGSGIRSVRVANEIEGSQVIINDANPYAVELITKNVNHLHLNRNTAIHLDDANSLMLKYMAKGERFHVIDIDPFGSPSQFIDSAVQALDKNSLLAITSTDMATMCGVYSEACVRKYASTPIHTSLAHEVAVRMLISYSAIALARHGKSCLPIFAHSTAHYIRVYLHVRKGITSAKENMAHLGYIAHCQNCLMIESSKGIVNSLTKNCPNCQKNRLIGGPYWISKVYDEQFVENLAKEIQRENAPYNTKRAMKKVILIIQDEIKANKSSKAMIGFYDLHQIADKHNIPCPKMASVVQELEEAGFLATKTHFRENSLKTDASINEIVIIMKKLVHK